MLTEKEPPKKTLLKLGVHMTKEDSDFVHKIAQFRRVGVSTLLRLIIKDWIEKEIKK